MKNLEQEFIQDFGEAYHRNGLPTLMGRIVGLLLYVESPISLDEVTKRLNVSKGPVSQVMRRLREHHLIQRVWVPGDRKDYYQAEADIFGNAFNNQMTLMHQNLELARKYRSNTQVDSGSKFYERMQEMNRFYELMEEHFRDFQGAWQEKRRDSEM